MEPFDLRTLSALQTFAPTHCLYHLYLAYYLLMLEFDLSETARLYACGVFSEPD